MLSLRWGTGWKAPHAPSRRTFGGLAGSRPREAAPAKLLVANPESDFAFDPETGTITDYAGASEDVRIPASIGGRTVARIGKKAFQFKRIRSVVIPDGVTSIGDYAFADNNLESVVIPENVARIGAYAFSYNRLKRVTVLRHGVSFDEHVFAGNGDWPFAELTISGFEGSNAALYAVRNRHRFEPIGQLSAVTG